MDAGRLGLAHSGSALKFQPFLRTSYCWKSWLLWWHIRKLQHLVNITFWSITRPAGETGRGDSRVTFVSETKHFPVRRVVSIIRFVRWARNLVGAASPIIHFRDKLGVFQVLVSSNLSVAQNSKRVAVAVVCIT